MLPAYSTDLERFRYFLCGVQCVLLRTEKTDEHPGVQIDMLISRGDDVVNLCEMKYYSGEYLITEADVKDFAVKTGVCLQTSLRRLADSFFPLSWCCLWRMIPLLSLHDAVINAAASGMIRMVVVLLIIDRGLLRYNCQERLPALSRLL